MSKIVLVTGASAGFGIAIVKTLVADGYQVIACARRFDKLQELQAELGQDKVYPLQMDVAQPKAIDAALASLPEQWRAIDVLVNNAGLALSLTSSLITIRNAMAATGLSLFLSMLKLETSNQVRNF